MAFNLFKKKKKGPKMMEKPDIDIPPVSMPEESMELPTFPTPEEMESPKKESAVDEMERQAIRGVESELGERGEMELTRPIFIEAKLYKAVMDDVGVLKNILKDNTDRLQTISNLKDSREKSYGTWHKQIEDIQRKLIYADNTLFSKKR